MPASSTCSTQYYWRIANGLLEPETPIKKDRCSSGDESDVKLRIRGGLRKSNLEIIRSGSQMLDSCKLRLPISFVVSMIPP
mmetsp:Transcript_68080/g.181905  ORF Transcript_68080/g.181905 Transcript_68080/m.181905 type:complete len:81 (-) Transcript_68080:105-347(-)